jgi:hypothetical protein
LNCGCLETGSQLVGVSSFAAVLSPPVVEG